MTTRTVMILLFLLATYATAEESSTAQPNEPAMHSMSEHMEHMEHTEHMDPMSMSDVGMVMPAEAATRTINVTLSDAMKIDFGDPLDIHQGEVIHFVVKNIGKLEHEFSISSLTERKEHAEMMKKMPGMKHQGGNTLTLDPGESKDITWHFMGKSRVIFACNIPGHAEAGMIKMAMLTSTEKSPGDTSD